MSLKYGGRLCIFFFFKDNVGLKMMHCYEVRCLEDNTNTCYKMYKPCSVNKSRNVIGNPDLSICCASLKIFAQNDAIMSLGFPSFIILSMYSSF